MQKFCIIYLYVCVCVLYVCMYVCIKHLKRVSVWNYSYVFDCVYSIITVGVQENSIRIHTEQWMKHNP